MWLKRLMARVVAEDDARRSASEPMPPGILRGPGWSWAVGAWCQGVPRAGRLPWDRLPLSSGVASSPSGGEVPDGHGSCRVRPVVVRCCCQCAVVLGSVLPPA